MEKNSIKSNKLNKLNNLENLNKLRINLKILNNFYELIYKNILKSINELILSIETILICKNEENGQILQLIYETLDISFLYMNCSQKSLEISLSILQRLLLYLSYNSNTVTGPPNSTNNSTEVTGNKDTPNSTNTNNLTTSTTGPSTVTPGKGANFMGTECTPGKGANFMGTECNRERELNDTFDTTGKGANFTAMECTPGKGANFMPMKCTSSKDTKGISEVDPFGAGCRGTDTVMEKLINKIIEKQIESRLFIELTNEKLKLITNKKNKNYQINGNYQILEYKFKYHINNLINYLNKLIKESNLLITNQLILLQITQSNLNLNKLYNKLNKL
ncbi:uncharacterized protein TA08000 [Theileria annulata]|uniref:Uncharacterized protein n=1 Tax=Theileria annulata TaxID=5874 RepID=Q4UAK2_THEAN|nr:uncharacterized protein TA08000 [Theileria annulata]CAI76149.1 hypothetical protein TA08000 [Theileria annulata]|eukprot:XP_952775.1 hypothetical protein TA08000 [Theileria annulata]